MKTKERIFIAVFITLLMTELIVAFITAADSCGKGGDIYAIAGFICLSGNFLLPFFNRNVFM